MSRKMNAIIRISNEANVEILNKEFVIEDEITNKIESIDSDESPIGICNIGDIVQKHLLWRRLFPNVEPFYAVKTNDLDVVLRVLADLGLSFDCASKIEIQKVLDLGVDPSKIIYTNPFKQVSFLKYAKEKEVDLLVFDSEDELRKIAKTYPSARLLLRIKPSQKTTTSKAVFDLGKKYGCSANQVKELFSIAYKLNLDVVGISFHVGSKCTDISLYHAAIKQSREAFDIAREVGFTLEVLDIGAGFPGSHYKNVNIDITMEMIANTLNTSLEKYFPGQDVKLIAEPGRFYVDSAFTVATAIIGKRIQHEHQNGLTCEYKLDNLIINNDTNVIPEREYFVNDGVYGVFNSALFDPGCYVPCHLSKGKKNDYNTKVWGPVCDSFDVIIENCKLPDLKQGDWIYFTDIGAYSFPCVSRFNSMPTTKLFYFCEQQYWEMVSKCK